MGRRPVLALSLGLAAGVLVEIALGPNLLRSALTSLLTAIFLSPWSRGAYFRYPVLRRLLRRGRGSHRGGARPRRLVSPCRLGRPAWSGRAGPSGLPHVRLGSCPGRSRGADSEQSTGPRGGGPPAPNAGGPVGSSGARRGRRRRGRPRGGRSGTLSGARHLPCRLSVRRLGRSPVVLLSYRNQLFLHLPAFTGFTFGAAVMAGPALEAAGDEGCRKPRDGKRFFWGSSLHLARHDARGDRAPRAPLRRARTPYGAVSASRCP